MDSEAAVRALAALAQPSRLAIFRTLVRAGAQGLGAGALAAAVDVPPSTLSFHLRDLAQAGLLHATRNGRTIHYALRAETWTALLFHLGEDCCQGRPALCPSPAARIGRSGTPAPRPHVLFLCSHNAARSQLAEALLRQLAGDRFEVHSAGVRPSALHPHTLAVLTEASVPTAGLRSKDLGELLGKQPFEHAIVVCPTAQGDCAQLPVLAQHQHYWPFPDPLATQGSARRQLAAFRSVRDGIRDRLTAWLRDLDQPPTARRRPNRGKATSTRP